VLGLPPAPLEELDDELDGAPPAPPPLEELDDEVVDAPPVPAPLDEELADDDEELDDEDEALDDEVVDAPPVPAPLDDEDDVVDAPPVPAPLDDDVLATELVEAAPPFPVLEDVLPPPAPPTPPELLEVPAPLPPEPGLEGATPVAHAPTVAAPSASTVVMIQPADLGFTRMGRPPEGSGGELAAELRTFAHVKPSRFAVAQRRALLYAGRVQRAKRSSMVAPATALSVALLTTCVPVTVPEPPAPAETVDADAPTPLGARADAWTERGLGGIRGVTIGPIESQLHQGVGYGSPAYERTLDEIARMGGTWVSLTPFGRTWDLRPTGIDLTFEAPFEENRRAVLAGIRQAHARGLRVLLVPHLWVETGGWRALIDPGDDAGWARWAEAYRAFLLTWAEVAREGEVDLLSVGVELRSWVTTPRAASMLGIIADVRAVYPGPLTYSANWDDVEDTLIFTALDLIGINAFYPLAEHDGASRAELRAGGQRVAARIGAFARAMERPVVLTEIGYTTRTDPAVRPWEWPDGMQNVHVDEAAQAEAYGALIAPFLEARWCAGLFVWRLYADPDDVSQEAEWGFSPRGKLAELVLRDAFTARWAADGPRVVGDALGRQRARTPGFFGWERQP